MSENPWRQRFLVSVGGEQLRAQKDKARLAEAGLWASVIEMLQAIQRDPWHTPPPCETLKGDLTGLLSRRITYTFRLVDEVDRKARIVKILAMWTHYEYQPVVKVSRRTEIDDAPGSPGAKRENSGDY